MELHAEWMKGESAPMGFWRTRVFALLAGGRASSQRKRGHPTTCCLGAEEPGFLQAGRGSAVGKLAQSTIAPP